MHRWILILLGLAAFGCFCSGARASDPLTLEDIVQQPADAASNATEGHFRDKFVYYERDRFFVPTRLLLESDIKACIDLRRPVCTARYYSQPEVLKAASLYFAFPLSTTEEIVRTSIRPSISNDLMLVTTTRSMTPSGLSLHIEVERRREGSMEVERFTRWAMFRPSRQFAGLRINFGERVIPAAWTESLHRLRQHRLRQAADAAIRINNHFYSEAAGKNRIRHGSGFFYRSRSQIMTAWHNLAPNADCRKHLRCELRFMHTDSRGVRRSFRQTVTIIAHSPTADFAILRVRVPDDIPAKVLPVARRQIGPEVSVVGYPAPGFDLLYSHGYLNSLTVGTTRLVASAHVVGGFSGAPVIDLASGQVVGFAKAWQRPRGQSGDGGPVSLNVVKVLEQAFGI